MEPENSKDRYAENGTGRDGRWGKTDLQFFSSPLFMNYVFAALNFISSYAISLTGA